MKTISKILVTGATGHQGYAVARELLHNGFTVHALVRDRTKDKALDLENRGAKLVVGDLNDSVSIQHAVDGVEGVFAMQDFFSAGFDQEIEQGCRLADIALEKQVTYFVYSSVGGADRQKNIPHFESKKRIETHLDKIDLPHSIFRPVFFYYNYFQSNLRKSLQEGVLTSPLSANRKLQQLSEHDYAILVSLAFASFPDLLGKTYELASSDLSMGETAKIFSNVLNKPIHYQQISFDDFERQAGREMRLMYEWFENVGYAADFPFMRRQIGDLQSLESYLLSKRFAI